MSSETKSDLLDIIVYVGNCLIMNHSHAFIFAIGACQIEPLVAWGCRRGSVSVLSPVIYKVWLVFAARSVVSLNVPKHYIKYCK